MHRADVVRVARSFQETPYQKDQCLKGIGADCICLVKTAYIEAGLPVTNPGELVQKANGIGYNMLLDLFTSFGFVKTDIPKPGDVVIWNYTGVPHHTGIVTEITPKHTYVIHESDRYSKAVEHQLIGEWKVRFNRFLTHPLFED